MSAIDVSILIVSYNTREETLACLRSVYAQTRRVSFEVIVVDNNSADGSADAIAREFPQARLVASPVNLGFARGNNAAATGAGGEYLLLLNPDTVVLDGAIDRIVAFAAAHPLAGAYGGRTLFGDGSLNRNSCHGRPTLWSLLCMGVGVSSLFRRSALFNPEGLGAWARDSVRAVDCVTGCFLLMRRALWQQLGGFDESFFMYGEDTDLSIRAAAAAGPNLICPEATIIHLGGKSEKIRADKMVRLFRAKVHLFQKHWPAHQVGFGVAMLRLWALTRTVATWLALRLGRDCRASHDAWREIWRRRAEYGRTAADTARSPALSAATRGGDPSVVGVVSRTTP